MEGPTQLAWAEIFFSNNSYFTMRITFLMFQVRHCLEECELCSDMGVSSRWIRIDSEICQPWFQIKVRGGTASPAFLLLVSLPFTFVSNIHILLSIKKNSGPFVQHNIRFLQEILQNRKSDFLEWLIIILIGVEILISVYNIVRESTITSLWNIQRLWICTYKHFLDRRILAFTEQRLKHTSFLGSRVC